MPKVLFILLLITWQTFAQDGYLKGKSIDATTNEPISFATIAIKGKAVGVISNLDGGFILPERFNSLGNTLAISSMGYLKKEILISILSSNVTKSIYLQFSIVGFHTISL